MIKNIIELNGIPLWFFSLTALLAVACGLDTKKWIPVLLISYVLIIIGETILFRTPGKSGIELTLFWSYELPELKAQITANILLFIPFGFLAGKLCGWRTIPLAAFFSFYIEVIQQVFCLGLFEIDDFIHNTTGAVIGYLPVLIANKIIKKRKRNK